MPTAPTRRGPARPADEGVVVAIAAVTGDQDSVQDIIVPGAFTRTLRAIRPKFCWMHDWKIPLGAVLSVLELRPGDLRLPKRLPNGKPWPKHAGALLAKLKFNLHTSDGRDFYEHCKLWAQTGEAAFSIGYRVPPGQASKRGDGVRLIYGLDLFEISLVLHGAHVLALGLEVKANAGGAGGLEYRATDHLMLTEVAGGPAFAALLEAKNMPVTPRAARAALIEAKSLPIPATEAKSMRNLAGSYEERRNLISTAVDELLTPRDEKGDRDGWVCVDATFDDHVIVTHHENGPGDDGRSYRIPYRIQEGAAALGKPAPVELTVVVAPDGEDGPSSPVEEGEAVRLRFVEPTASMLADATRYLRAIPEGKGMDVPSLESAIGALMDALAVKGYDVAAVLGDDEYLDDPEMPVEHDQYTGERKVATDAPDEPDDDEDWDDGEDVEWEDEPAGADPEPAPVEDDAAPVEDDEDEEMVMLDPDDVARQIKELTAA